MRTILAAAVAALVVLGSACASGGGADKAASSSGGRAGKLDVVASFYPLAEVVTAVAGDRASVTNLTTAGTEPHDLELTPDQVDAVQDADVVIYLGNGFQPVVEKAIRGRKARGTIDVVQAVDPVDDAKDPHVWLDPKRMLQIVTAIERAMANVDPDGQPTYAAGATGYRSKLEALDGEFAAGLQTCARREIVTAHAAFHYLAARYGLEQKAIAGISPEAEPDPQRMAELADEIKDKGVTTVFTEELVSPKVAEALAREAHVKTAVLDPIEGLSTARQHAGANYLTVMRANLAALREALGCTS